MKGISLSETSASRGKTVPPPESVGSALDATNPAVAKISNGEAYYGDATIFGKPYVAGYEPIKDASGAVIGAYFVGQQK